MCYSTISQKGQTTLPKPVREALNLSPGDRVRFVVLADGQVRIIPALPVSRLFGAFPYGDHPVTLEEMNKAIADGAAKE